MNNPAIQAIFFDLGKVIFNFDHNQIALKLLETLPQRHHVDPKTIFESCFHPAHGLCCDFDRGEITPHEFHENICTKFGLKLSFENFVPIWNEIFTENHEVTRIIKELSEHYRLFLLSNTNALHFQHIRKNFPILDRFESFILSYEVGASKPEEKIYREALQRAGLDPSQTLYTDDILEYIHAAGNLGIHCIHFITAKKFKIEISELLSFDFSE